MRGDAADILGSPASGPWSQFDRGGIFSRPDPIPPGRFADRQDRRDRGVGFGVAANLIDANQTGFRKGIAVRRHVSTTLVLSEQPRLNQAEKQRYTTSNLFLIYFYFLANFKYLPMVIGGRLQPDS